MKHTFITILVLVSLYILIIGIFNIGDFKNFHAWIGKGFLLFSIPAIIFSGAAVSGDRIRANYTNELKKDRNERVKLTEILLFSAVLLGGIWLLLERMNG